MIEAAAALRPIAIALLLAVIAAAVPRRLLRWRPRRLAALGGFGDPDARRWRIVAGALLLAALVLVTVTAGDYGYNIDEWYQSDHGVALVDWYGAKLAGDHRPFTSEIAEMDYYGGAFEILAELASRLSPLDRTTTRHLITAWFAVLGLWGAYLLGRAVHSRAAGCVAIVLLWSTPRFYGHAFNNPKDIPFAVCVVFSLWAICRALPRLPDLSWRRILGLGALIGAGMGIRCGGIIVYGIFGLGLVWWLGG